MRIIFAVLCNFFLLISWSVSVFSSEKMIDYAKIRPVLEKRCMVCHGCYDAPCQLKLTSYSGVDRGASKEKVYDGERIRTIQPTRLFIDAQSTAEWRQKGFYSLISGEQPEDSVLYRILKLKEDNPQPLEGRLPNNHELGLNRTDYCPKPDEFDDFASKHPHWGMPYAMPNLPVDEYKMLLAWAKQGAPGQLDALNTPELPKLARDYEFFLNRSSLKSRLMSRYVFEHLFLGHIHFEGSADDQFYQLVRSKTPPGQPINLIPTARPYDDPETDRVYYRLRPVTWSIVDKDHLVYNVDEKTAGNYRKWFLSDDVEVDELPGYDPVKSTNPFTTFWQLPAQGRYRFMLDQAQFIIGGFIKGPVCRGQTALNVIEDRFWVMFFDPELDVISRDSLFLRNQADNLSLPSEEGRETFRVLDVFTKYKARQEAYLEAKKKHLLAKKLDTPHDFNLIWNGDGDNRNALLTIFRNQDSATVLKGLWGSVPKTAWIIDYPLLERIQYLLVSGYDVYGNVGHQLNTRLYMDFLRMEGENNFLSYLPASKRESVRSYWYRNTPIEMFKDNLQPTVTSIEYHVNKGIKEVAKALPEAQAKSFGSYRISTRLKAEVVQSQLLIYEFFGKFMQHLEGNPILNKDPINRAVKLTEEKNLQSFAEHLATSKGSLVSSWPDVSFLRVTLNNGRKAYYTLILDKGYYNVTSLLFDEKNRVESEDAVTILSGLKGSYPNMFFDVVEKDLSEFLDLAGSVKDQASLSRWVSVYGVRRTNPKFWDLLDDFHEFARQSKGKQFGLFDLNRYRND